MFHKHLQDHNSYPNSILSIFKCPLFVLVWKLTRYHVNQTCFSYFVFRGATWESVFWRYGHQIWASVGNDILAPMLNKLNFNLCVLAELKTSHSCSCSALRTSQFMAGLKKELLFWCYVPLKKLRRDNISLLCIAIQFFQDLRQNCKKIQTPKDCIICNPGNPSYLFLKTSFVNVETTEC